MSVNIVAKGTQPIQQLGRPSGSNECAAWTGNGVIPLYLRWHTGPTSPSARPLFPVAPPVDSLNVVRMIVTPRTAHAAGTDVVGYDVAVIRELFVAESTLTFLGHNLLVQQLSHLRIRADLAITAWVSTHMAKRDVGDRGCQTIKRPRSDLERPEGKYAALGTELGHSVILPSTPLGETPFGRSVCTAYRNVVTRCRFHSTAEGRIAIRFRQ